MGWPNDDARRERWRREAAEREAEDAARQAASLRRRLSEAEDAARQAASLRRRLSEAEEFAAYSEASALAEVDRAHDEAHNAYLANCQRCDEWREWLDLDAAVAEATARAASSETPITVYAALIDVVLGKFKEML